MRPPKLAKRLFIWYSGTAQVDDLVGDMDEIFRANLTRMSPSRARVKYWLQVLSLIVSYAIRKRRQRSAIHPHSNDSINFHMIRNYFLIAWRTMTRNKVYTVINVLGLSLGVSACLLVYMVVNYEFSFDRFHPEAETIFRVKTHDDASGWTCTCVPAPLYPTLRDQYAGAEAVTGYHEYNAKATIVEGEQVKNFERKTSRIILTDPAYFRIFKYEWLAGKPDGLARSANVVLTESRARSFFGTTAPHELIGKNIAYNDSLNVTVIGVVRDFEENSDFAFTEFISFSTIEHTFLRNEVNLTNWGQMFSNSQSFVKTRKGDDPNSAAAQMTGVIVKHTSEKYSVQLENIEDIHFKRDDFGQSNLEIGLIVLTGLAGFILVIAAINFVNLSTAQSIKRSREIGIRKVMGSIKLQIVFQFLSETLVLTIFAMCLSVALLGPLMWLFGDFLPAGLSFDILSFKTWMFLGSLIIIVSLLAGCYPALVLSSYRPATTLSGRGESKSTAGFSLRKLLIIFQFSASLFFIIATMVIQNQMDMIRRTDRGFSAASVISFEVDSRAEKIKIKTLAARIRTMTGISEVATQGWQPMGYGRWTSTAQFEVKGEKIEETVSVKPGDDRFIPLYSMRLIAGRSPAPSDTLREVVINQLLSKRLGFENAENAIGERIKIGGADVPICGVVQDFHEFSFHEAIGYTVIGNFHEQSQIALRLENPDIVGNAEVIAKIEAAFNQVYPGEMFHYNFVEDEIQGLHGEEQKISKLATIAMAVTIFISCMGVFGLAMFTAAMRTREIGIRKVLGATPFSITNMLSREFLLLIVVSIALATPVAWYAMDEWLLTFQYRTDLTIGVFVMAGLIALATGLATVSYQALKAALGDPVKALRVD